MDERERNVLEKVRELYQKILGDNLVGIYVHGSTALGGFSWERSDIDFFVVVKASLSLDTKRVLMKKLVNLHENANPRGLEMSVVLASDCKAPHVPTPFDLHFSNGTIEWYRREPEQYCKNMVGDDADLGSYMAVIKQSGIVLCGEPIDKVFGDVTKELYLKSVLWDLEDAKKEYLENYAYHTLNFCRTLAYLDDGIIRSKKSGGEWGLTHLPDDFKKLILASLDLYCKGIESEVDPETMKMFCSYAFQRIQ